MAERKIMPIERLPKNQNYKPAGGTPYKVKTNDNWGSIAKANGIDENTLVSFNCGTTEPAEVNWFLRNKVGCVRPTHDQKNWMFTTEARPGVIYLPPPGTRLARPPLAPVGSTANTNAWFGLGMKAGTMFAVAGIETMAGYVASLDDVGKGMVITASINRLGVGWGVTGGACFIYITGVANPQKLNGWQQGDTDFNLSLGENWGKMAEASTKIKKLKPLIDVVAKTGTKIPDTLKHLLKAEPDKWVELIKAGQNVKDFKEINPHGEPNVLVFDVPYGGAGLEASLFFGVSNFNAVLDLTK
jgi:hypothetical protein